MLDGIAGLVEASGPLIYVLAPLFTVVVAILPFPAEVPAMLNGMVFGPVVGVVVTWGGGFVGAMISFDDHGRGIGNFKMPVLSNQTGWTSRFDGRFLPDNSE